MKKLSPPKFASETEEADWWYANRRAVEARLFEAIRNGTAGRGAPLRLTREALAIEEVALPIAELDRARELCAKKKIDYRTYLKNLLHDALDREEAAAKKSRTGRTAR